MKMEGGPPVKADQVDLPNRRMVLEDEGDWY
jgi:hypothetical protein